MSDIGGANPEGSEIAEQQPDSVSSVSREGIVRIQGTEATSEVTDTSEAAPPPTNPPTQVEPPVVESATAGLSKKAISAIQGEE